MSNKKTPRKKDPKNFRICKVCGKKFYLFPCQVKRGVTVCSRECSFKNPDRKKKSSLTKEQKDNISKNHHNVSGENNPNWKGGIGNFRAKWVNKNWKKVKSWREGVLKKANYKCVLCGSTEKLEAHHIVPFKETRKPSLELWNGVCLCKKCHIDTESYGGKSSYIVDKFSKQKIIVKFVPLQFQEYETLGNYKNIGRETYFIITDTGNDLHNRMIFLHELIEQTLTEAKGIKESQILRHDLEFEKLRQDGLVGEDDEPGEHKNSPYKQEHIQSEIIERQLLNYLNIDFKEYTKQISKVFTNADN